ncbi:unnamed protein product [Symbiodinium necroappetens]|uniref:Major facilitator superfamily (MFS) profile domain-containing protein n=1 Tax=Symbiodinium necroappetens TaxID=1628268 RepID=A0A813BNZ2_9DINO|nr:unnamed protein product [Symbiodinium necroappetens]
MATMTCTVTEAETCSDFGSNPCEKEPSPSTTTEKSEDKDRMPPTASLVIIHYFLVLATVNCVIAIPTANDYAERLGAGRLFAGIMLGAMPILSIAGNLFNQKLFACVPFKHIWILSSLFTVLGSVLYALAGLMRFKWTLLIARGLMGFFAAVSLPGIYVSRTVGLNRRSEILFYFSACLTLGCAVGPALAAMLEVSVKFIKINNLVLDSDTIPGWFMATLYLLFTVKLLLFFKDLPRDAPALPAAEGRTLRSPRSPKQRLSFEKVLAACACFWQLFVASAVTTGVEVYAISTTRSTLGWSISGAAWFVALIMLVAGVINLSLGKVIRTMACGDVPGLLAGELLACASCIFLFNFDVDSPSLQVSLLTLGLVSVLITQGFARALALRICSKMVPSESINGMMTSAAIFMGLGRGGGAIVCSALSPDSFAPVLLALFVVTLALSVATRKHMRPDMKAS